MDTNTPQYPYTPSGPTSGQNCRSTMPTGDSKFDYSHVDQHITRPIPEDTPSCHWLIAPFFKQPDMLQGLDWPPLLIEQACLDSITVRKQKGNTEEWPTCMLKICC